MTKNKRFLQCLLTLTFALGLCASYVPTAAASNVYTVQYLDKVTNQAIAPPIINVFVPEEAFSVSGQANYNGYQLDSCLINDEPTAHSNGVVAVHNPTANSYSFVYFYSDKEAPKVTIKQYAFFEQNGETDPTGILANLYDNSGVSNISIKYVGTQPDAAEIGIQNVEIELVDRSGNKTNISGEVSVVGKARYTASFMDSSTGNNIREAIVAPLMIGENKSLQFSFPVGYELTTVEVDGIIQTSGTVVISDAEDRNYNVVFNLKDFVPPEIKVIGQTSFQRGDSIDLAKLISVSDNSGDGVTLTGNINTSKAGVYNVPITARDATGNYSTINFSYTVYGSNTYTIQYINKLNNQDLLPRSEPIQFNTKDDVTITLPTIHNGFSLVDADLGANQSRASADVKNGKVNLTNLNDTSFVCRAFYLDEAKPIGTARTDIKVKKGAQVNITQCLAYVYDNAGIEGLTAYFSGNAPDTNTVGTKNSIIFIKDATGNISDPINVLITVEGENDYVIGIRYIDDDTDRVIKTDTIIREKGAVISRGDLSVPSGYQLVNKNFSFTVAKDSTIDVDVQNNDGRSNDGKFNLTVEYVDWEKTNSIISTQRIYADYGQTIESSDLKLPAGYGLYTSFSRYRVYNDSTVTVKVKKNTLKEIIINFMDGSKKVGTQTLKNYTKDMLQTTDLVLPSGYTFTEPHTTSYPKAGTITISVKEAAISVYVVRQCKSDEHSDIAVPGKPNNFKTLHTYKSSNGANTSNYRTVLELVKDTKTNTWFYIVDESGQEATVETPNPIGSSIKVEITNGVVYVATYPEGLHSSYIAGYEVGGRREFRADRVLTRAEFSTLIYRNFVEPFKDGSYSTSSFADVSTDSWYFQPVEAMRQLYIVNGYDDVEDSQKRLFKPNQPITKAEAATLLSRVRNIKPQYMKANYSDISEDAWYKDTVYEAAALGYFRYIDGAFNPQNPMTRGETIFAFNIAMDRSPLQAEDYRNPFEDLNSTHPYYADIMEATITHKYVTDGDMEKRPDD